MGVGNYAIDDNMAANSRVLYSQKTYQHHKQHRPMVQVREGYVWIYVAYCYHQGWKKYYVCEAVLSKIKAFKDYEMSFTLKLYCMLLVRISCYIGRISQTEKNDEFSPHFQYFHA